MVWAELPFKLQLVVVKSIELLINFTSLFFNQTAQLFVQFVPLCANILNKNFFSLHFTDKTRQLCHLCLDISVIHFYFLLNLNNILINALPQGLKTFSRLPFRSLDIPCYFVLHQLDLVVVGCDEGQDFITELVQEAFQAVYIVYLDNLLLLKYLD